MAGGFLIVGVVVPWNDQVFVAGAVVEVVEGVVVVVDVVDCSADEQRADRIKESEE